jgi:four helix bundle protein
MREKRMSIISNYKDLLVWQRSMSLVEKVYRICLKLPDSEKWGLISQMQRAAVSVPSNIAEGFGRQATGEYRHHLSMSRGSLLELETQLILTQRLGYISQEDIYELLNEITELSSMLASLISKLR